MVEKDQYFFLQYRSYSSSKLFMGKINPNAVL